MIFIEKHQFRGAFPEVGIYPDLDTARIYSDDDNPFHVILRLAQVGEESANKRPYRAVVVTTLAERMQKLGGNCIGHQFLNGALWALVYIPAGQERETLRRLMREGSAIWSKLVVEGNTPVALTLHDNLGGRLL
jgi:hypothetical protein